MLSRFQKFIKEEDLFLSEDKVLLAVSGGADSVVMAHLFSRAGFLFSIAHCNFNLRGVESDGDEVFVEQLAKDLGVQFHSITFDTVEYSKKEKVSIQVAARELRYTWFETIRKEYDYSYIATAHHLNDSIETYFINLLRGTSIAGLRGILPIKDKLIRPLLFLKRAEIESFSSQENLAYRNDSSNASDKYVRNNLRHNLVPLLNKINPSAEDSIIATMKHLKSVEQIYKNEVERMRGVIVEQKSGEVHLNITHLKNTDLPSTYLYEFLKDYGFSSSMVEEILSSLEGDAGKVFFSSTHRVLKDRTHLVVVKRSDVSKATPIQVSENDTVIKYDGFKLSFIKGVVPTDFSKKSPLVAHFDFNKLVFPLTIRHWQHGDVFQPLGMKGKKKLSDFFIDKKISRIDKEKVYVLCSSNEIAWVIGHRLDDRFKITSTTSRVLTVNVG